MMTTLAVATPHALVLTVSHGLLFRQPPSNATAFLPPFLVHEWLFLTNDTPTARPDSSVAKRPNRPSGLTAANRRQTPSFNVTKPRQRRPHHRSCRGVANPSSRARPLFANARQTDAHLGLNVAIPFAVRSGFRSSLGLRCQPLGASLLRALLRAFKATRHRFSGRFRARKLVGSGPHSKCFFAGVQCSTVMPPRSQQGRAAHR
jgi:hypothetical protein